MTTQYNGWSNYPTWNVNLWLSNDEATQSYVIDMALDRLAGSKGDKEEAAIDLMDDIKSMVEQDADEFCTVPGLYGDLLTWAIDMADYYEIAKSWIDDVYDEYEPDEEDEQWSNPVANMPERMNPNEYKLYGEGE